MNNKKKILIVGPISDFGGRELESGFIAAVLSSKYEVDICTTGSLSSKSQVFDFNKKQNVFSLQELLCQEYIALRILSLLSYFKNNCSGIWTSYANNNIAKRYFDYNRKIIFVTKKLVNRYDVIFICAQLSSTLINDIVSFASRNNKKIIFRTTGTIKEGNFNYIDNVDLFVHHSKGNALNLEKFKKHKYTVIDQCSFNEQDLLNVNSPKNRIKNFLVLGRLSSEKGIEQIIAFFLQVCSKEDNLYIAGNGSLENQLRDKYKESHNIKFTGFVDRKQLTNLFNIIDCLIICSPEESGPLVGVEAMAGGKIIISTRVGAMAERLDNTLNQFWFDYDNLESFQEVFQAVKLLDEDRINAISQSLRSKYLNEYSIDQIKKKYLVTVNESCIK